MRLERYFSFIAACCACCCKQLSRLTVSVAALLAGCAALRATRRFVLKALGGIEFLLTGGEHELIAAVTASHGFVLIHDLPPSSSHGFGIQTWLEAGDWFKKRHDKPNPASSMLTIK